jgi:hypothetical protein
VELHGLIIGADETDAGGGAEEFFFGLVLGPDDLEDGVEGDHEAALAGLAVHGMIEHRFGSEDEDDRLRVVALEVEGRAEDGV